MYHQFIIIHIGKCSALFLNIVPILLSVINTIASKYIIVFHSDFFHSEQCVNCVRIHPMDRQDTLSPLTISSSDEQAFTLCATLFSSSQYSHLLLLKAIASQFFFQVYSATRKSYCSGKYPPQLTVLRLLVFLVMVNLFC